MRFDALLATMVGFCAVSASSAAPLQFHVNMKGGTENPDNPLRGADIRLALSWDPSTVTPVDVSKAAYKAVIWPSTGTSVTMSVSGSPSHDGQYEGTAFNSSSDGFFYTDNHPDKGDSVGLPPLTFQVGGGTILFPAMTPRFAADYFENSGFTPAPFPKDAASWLSFPIAFNTLSSRILAMNVAGFATTLPEPSTLWLGAIGVFALASLRSRN